MMQDASLAVSDGDHLKDPRPPGKAAMTAGLTARPLVSGLPGKGARQSVGRQEILR